MILGIDIGATGCLVVLDDEDHYRYKGHLHMPTIKVASKTRVNGAAIAAWLHNYDLSMAYVELVNGMPNPVSGVSIGAASAFSFGHSAGMLEGVLQGALIPFQTVTPASGNVTPGYWVIIKMPAAVKQFNYTRG